MAGNVTPPPLLTGHMVNESVDADDPNGDVLVYESDMGPLGLRLDVYRTTTGDTVAYISPDWTEWSIGDESEMHDVITQAVNLSRWLSEARTLIDRLRGRNATPPEHGR